MFKKLKHIIFFLLVFTSVSAFAQNRYGVTDKWKSSAGEAEFQIYKKGDLYFGKISALTEPNDEHGKPKRDSNNPEQKLKSRPILGLEILKGFKYSGDGVYDGGTIYDPKSGKTYSCKMTLDGNKLKIRGFIGVSLLGRTEIWSRVR